ncbi:hypothetical protein QFZ77_007453 [Paenibacillus sp. V4I3]|nr:hypothetical protein [Paenibacillus sp. V4I3]MDQ0885354.1 hypothetical protein [Paenibacillus sp. V4I9]
MDMIIGKWKISILLHLMRGGTKRFNELRQLMPSVTQKMLTSHLRELEEEGIVGRVIYPQVPPKVEYSHYRIRAKPGVHHQYDARMVGSSYQKEATHRVKLGALGCDFLRLQKYYITIIPVLMNCATLDFMRHKFFI